MNTGDLVKSNGIGMGVVLQVILEEEFVRKTGNHALVYWIRKGVFGPDEHTSTEPTKCLRVISEATQK